MWTVGDIVAARIYKSAYHLVRIQEEMDEGGEYLCLKLDGGLLMLYSAPELKRIIVSFAGPVVVGHDESDEAGWCVWE